MNRTLNSNDSPDSRRALIAHRESLFTTNRLPFFSYPKLQMLTRSFVCIENIQCGNGVLVGMVKWNRARRWHDRVVSTDTWHCAFATFGN